MAVLHGTGIHKGIAIGPAYIYRPTPLQVAPHKGKGVVAEMSRFEAALATSLTQVQSLSTALPSVLRHEMDRVLEVQALLLADPGLVDRTRGAILQGMACEQAWHQAVNAYLEVFRSIQDEDLQARAVALRDVGRRVLAALLGVPAAVSLDTRPESILLAEMLGPSETLQLTIQPPVGLCLSGGTETSPAAIVARRLELPAVVGLGEDLLRKVSPGDPVVVDGGAGLIEYRPEEKALSYYRDRQRVLKAARPEVDVTAPANTADGWRVDVRVDLEQPAGLLSALARGAEGIGLARTDFMFFGRQSPPPEEEQYQAYSALLGQVPAQRVAFCTLSTGPEETIPFAAEPDIRNPLLGLRGVRLSLAYLSAFREQLRAILRAGAGRPLSIAFPMAESLSEVRAAQEWVRRAQQDLQNAGTAHCQDVTTALLLQTPLAVLNLESLSGEVDAFFLDLDRLTEYLSASDRHNLRVAHLFRPLHPVLLRMLGEAVNVAHRQGKRLDLCGEAAGQPGAVALLLGLGVDGFCLPADRIPQTKAVLSRLTIPDAQSLAKECVSLQSAPEVEAMVEEFIDRRTQRR